MRRFLLLITFISSIIIVKGQEVKVFSVYFAFDVSTISEYEKVKIEKKIIPFLKSTEVVSALIVGNTDSYSTNDYNQKLGLARANSVKNILLPHLPSNVTCKSLGKSTPRYSNETEEGRRSNRRVDVILTYKTETAETVVIEQETIAQKLFENDTIIKCPKGVELHIKAETFYPNKISDVTFKIEEVLSPYSIIQNNLSTMTADGRCLESGGMILTQATVDGVPVQPNDSITIRIPATSIDTSMKLWDIEVVDGDTLWVESDIELNFNEEEQYYEFKTTSMPSINVDAPVVSNVVDGVGSLIDKITQPFKDDNTTIKSRGKRFVECYLVSNDELIVLKGDLIKAKKSYFEPCLIDPNDIVIAHIINKKGKDFYVIKPLGAIKLKNFFNRFVIRKRDLKDIKTYSEYEKEMQQVCEQLAL